LKRLIMGLDTPKIDKKPFFYSITRTPGPFRWPRYRDIPKLKELNANAVKTYAFTAWAWGDPKRTLISHKGFYKKLADNGMYAVPMVYFQSDHITGFNPATWQNDETWQQWLAVLAEGKDDPAVLGWCVGN